MKDDVSVPVGEGTMRLEVAAPNSGARGAVIVLQEAFGVNDHIRDICTRLADAGYVAAAPHLFHRSGDPELGYEDIQQVMPYITQLQADDIEADVNAALEHLASMGFEGRRVAVLGFCMGGSVAFVAGCRWPLGAAVTFYGGGVAQGRFGFPSLLELAPTMQSPWLGLFGDLDPGIPIEEVERLEAAVATAEPATEVVRYAEANHGFNCDVRSSYHEPSAKDAWQRALTFLDRHLA